MKPAIKACAGLSLLTILVACGTVQEHRSRQFSAEWNTLDAEEQNRIGAATIQVGDTSKAVYIALGSPDYTLPFDWTTRNWTWIYWGSPAEVPTDPNGPIRFLSRSELRLPGPKDERRALRVTFQNTRLVQWELASIDPQEARRSPVVEMGDFPSAK